MCYSNTMRGRDRYSYMNVCTERRLCKVIKLLRVSDTRQ